jgi:hypothetical protein
MKLDPSHLLFEQYPPATLARFIFFHEGNPHVYASFKSHAYQMKSTGKQRYSAQAIIYVLRWEYDLKTQGDVFEINNDFTSIYARLLCIEDPAFLHFFELRRMPNKGIKSTEQQQREGSVS